MKVIKTNFKSKVKGVYFQDNQGAALLLNQNLTPEEQKKIIGDYKGKSQQL